MSTFDGRVKEFPDIRIDYFRSAIEPSRPPLAYFLSHVHSDHLVGLETCKSPFIYCSPATRELLLRLEKYPHRMNFAKGILETRKQTYRHLKNLLKPIPLETPTTIELAPDKSIRVTLFDANHCVGAVVFLIEGDGKAIIYTGDIRSEPWWVEALKRQPLLVPYALGTKQLPLKRLDCIYLDTTFCTKADPYRQFTSKADGLHELLEKLAKYPRGTSFYFDSWTFGYEEVWQTLSAFLGTQIHVDDYRLGLYLALANGKDPKSPEAPKLVGYHCGNHFQQGCLTTRNAQLHSCERGTRCEIWQREFVRITPIITRHKGVDVAELGAGGGQGDLDQHHELEVGDPATLGQLIALCASKLQSRPEALTGVLKLLTRVMDERLQTLPLDAAVGDVECIAEREDGDHDLANTDEIPIENLVRSLAKLVDQSKHEPLQEKMPPATTELRTKKSRADGLPKQITFPYSRHSSYSELCHLVEAFQPNDIHPCTVDYRNWTSSSSMSFMFGHLYNGAQSFSHDQEMLNRRPAPAARPIESLQSGPEKSNSSSARNNVEQRSALKRKASLLSSESRIDDRHPGCTSQDRSDGKAIRSTNQRSINVDHYSPPRNKRRAPSKTLSLDDAAKVALQQESAGFVTKSSARPSRDRGHQESAGSARSHDSLSDLDRAAIVCSSDRNGLALPSPQIMPIDGTSVEAKLPSHGISQAPPQRDPSVQSVLTATSPGVTRLAIRKEAYDAVLEGNGSRWTEVSLVSVRGHAVPEQEL